MLYYKSRKSSTQSHRTITISSIVVVLLTIVVCGCKRMFVDDTYDRIAESLSANFDSAHITLDQILINDKDSVLSYKETVRYYQDGGECLWSISPEALEKSDTLIRLMGKKTEEIGFSRNAFLVDSILADITRLKEQIADSCSTIYRTRQDLSIICQNPTSPTYQDSVSVLRIH